MGPFLLWYDYMTPFSKPLWYIYGPIFSNFKTFPKLRQFLISVEENCKQIEKSAIVGEK